VSTIFYPLATYDEWRWFQERTHAIRQEDTQGIAAYRNNRLVAVCVLDTFTPVSVTAHLTIADPFVLRDGFFKKVAFHIFVTCGKDRVFGLVPSNNHKALKLNRHIGFKQVSYIPNTIEEGVDTVVMCLEKHSCRFLPRVEEAA